jgi:Rrf2 family protein
LTNLIEISKKVHLGKNGRMRISAKADYAVQAAVGLATVGEVTRAEQIAERYAIPLKFLERILHELRHAGIVGSRRGPDGGYFLARDADAITIADVIRAVDGPLADVHGLAPEAVEYDGSLAVLQEIWIAVRANLRAVLEAVTIADLVAGRLPEGVERLTHEPGSWSRR